MDILVKIERFQVKLNVINLKSTQVDNFKIHNLVKSMGLLCQLARIGSTGLNILNFLDNFSKDDKSDEPNIL